MLTGYRTMIAASIALLGAVLQQAGIEIDQDGLVEAVMQIGGAIGAIYYRTQVGK